MAEVDLDIKINAIVDKKFKDIEKNLKKTDKVAQDTEKSFGKMAVGAAAVGVAITGIGSALSFVVDQAIIMEDLTTQFIAFTGSAEAAAEQVERIAEFSASTPFQLEDLANANRSLLAFGSSTEESLVQLKQLGEAAAATGSDIGELATIFGQIQAETRLSGERFNQLVERGINIGPALAESLGVAESQLRDLRSQGKITADDVAAAFEKMTTGSGQFAGSMERLSKTLSGSTSTLKDNFSQLAATVGSALTPALVSITNATSKVIKEFNEALQPEDETLSGELQKIQKQIELTEKNAGDLQRRIEAVSSGELKVSDESLERTNRDLAKTEEQLVRLSEEFRRLRQAQQGAESRDTQAKSREDELKKLEEQKAEEKAIQDAADAERVKREEEINAKILALRESQSENIRAVGRARTEEELAILDERGTQIAEKITEQEALRLENQGLFDEAERVRVEEQVQALNAIRANALADATKQGQKARAEELNFEKQTHDARVKFEQETWAQRAQTSQRGLAALASLQRTGSREAFEIGKAASIAQALVSIPATAIEAYKSLAGIPGVGPALGAAAAAAAVAAGTANVNRIRSTQFQAFADGGLVEGGIPGQDSVPALLTPGEVVVPERDFKSLNVANGSERLEERMFETNRLLQELVITTKENQGTMQSEGFLEEKFSSSTPGGIFYEAVDDSLSEPEKVEEENIRRGGGGIGYDYLKNQELMEQNRIRQERIA